MDKELQQLLDEARKRGASREQLDDILARYNSKKKEQPEEPFQFGVSDTESVSALQEDKEEAAKQERIESALAFDDAFNPVGRAIKKIPGMAELYANIENLIGSAFKSSEMVIRENLLSYTTANPGVAAAKSAIDSAMPIDNKLANTLEYMGDVFLEDSKRTIYNKYKDYGLSDEQINAGIVGNLINLDFGAAAKLTASTLVQQIPQLAAMVAAGPAAGAALLGSSAAGNKYAEIQDDPTLSSQDKALYSLAVGTAEGLAEYMFRTDVTQFKRAFGKKETLDQFRDALKKELKKETLLKSIAEEGGEELAVGVVDLLVESGLRGNFDNWDADAVLELADQTLVGSLMGGSIHGVTRGINALGSTKNERDIAQAKSDIDTLNKKKANATESEKKIINELIEEKMNGLVDLQGEDFKFYQNFSREDLLKVADLNTSIRKASAKYNASESDADKNKYKQEIFDLRAQKEEIENKYSENPRKYIRDGKEVSRAEFIDMVNNATPEELTTGQWGVQNDEEVDQLLMSKLPQDDRKEEERVPSPKQEGEALVQAEPIQRGGVEAPPTGGVVQEAKQVTLSDGTAIQEGMQVVAKNPATGADIQGTLVVEGDVENPRVSIETETDIVELGAASEIAPSDIKPFTEAVKEAETLTANEDGTLTYNKEGNPTIPKGTKLTVDADKGLSAVSVFSEGKFVPLTEDADREKGLRVQMRDQDGNEVQLYGQDALDATYNIMLAMNEAQAEQLNKLLDNEETINAIAEAEESARKDTKPAEEAERAAVEEVGEVTLQEVTDAEGFSKALDAAKEELSKDERRLDLQVSPVSVKEAKKIVDDGGKLFMTPDGLAGGYVTADGYIGGIFKDPRSKAKGVAGKLIEQALKEGGKYLDAYGTELENIYIKQGFRPVVRVPFAEEYADEGWDSPKSVLKGKPDVVFFVYDPDNAAGTAGEGFVTQNYEAAKEFAGQRADQVATAENTEELDIILLEKDGARKMVKESWGSDPRNVVQGKMTATFTKDGILFKTKEDTGRMKSRGGEMFVPNATIDTMPSIGNYKRGTAEYAYYVAGMMDIAEKSQGDPVQYMKSKRVKPEDIGKEGTPSAKRFTRAQGKEIAKIVSNFNKVLKKIGALPVEIVFTNNSIEYAENHRYLMGDEEVGSSKGMYIPMERTILINLDKATIATVAHEMLHAYVASAKIKRKNITEFTNIIEAELLKGSDADVKLAKELAAFRDQYIKQGVYGTTTKEDPIIAEEFLAQYVGMMAEYSEKLGPAKQISFVDKVRAAVVKFLARLGIVDKSLAAKIKTREEALDFIGGFVNALQGRVEAIKPPAVEKNVNTSTKFSRYQIKGDFTHTYFDKSDDYNKLVDDGKIVHNSSLVNIANKAAAITQPDSMVTAKVELDGKTIVDGNGGIFFIGKFGDVWAAAKRSAANSLANMINDSRKKNEGKGYLLLTSGAISKMITSPDGVKASMNILEAMVERGLIPTSDFRAALTAAGKKYNVDFSGRDSMKSIHKDIQDKFLNVSDSTFEKRGFFFEDVVDHIAKNSTQAKENIKAVRDMLGAQKRISFSKQGIKDAIGYVLAERIIDNLPSGHIYAYVEVTDDVVVVETKDHGSYPFVIRQKNGERPILHLLSERPKALDSVLAKDGSSVSDYDKSSVFQGKIGLAQMGRGSVIIKDAAGVTAAPKDLARLQIDFADSEMINEFSWKQEVPDSKTGKLKTVTKTEKSDKPIGIKFPDGTIALVRSFDDELKEAKQLLEEVKKGTYPYMDEDQVEYKIDLIEKRIKDKDLIVELIDGDMKYHKAAKYGRSAMPMGRIELTNNHYDYYFPKVAEMLGEDYKAGLMYSPDNTRGTDAVKIYDEFQGKGFGSRLYFAALRLLREQVPGARLISNHDFNVSRNAKNFWRSQVNNGLAKVILNTATKEEIEKIGGDVVLKQLKDIGAEYTGDIYELLDPTERTAPSEQYDVVSEDVARKQIDWQPSLFGREKVNTAIITRSTQLQQAVQDLLEGKITNAEYQEMAKLLSPVDPINQFFLPASDKDMQNALGKGKAKKLNAPLEDGEYVGLRLDIPAYVNNNIWVVTAHKGTGAPLTYGSVAWATDVKFGTNPKVAAFIAAGKNMDLVGRYRIDPVEVDGKTVYKFLDTKTGKYYAEKGVDVTKNTYKAADQYLADRLEKQDKSTIGKMLGRWKNFEGKTKEERDASAIKKVEEIVKIENSYPGATRKGSPWRQIGMNPFRHSFFYDRRTGKPVVAASEVVQIGGLVYAKDVEYADWSDDQFTVDGYYDADGAAVRFQLDSDPDVKAQEKAFDELDKGEIPAPLYKKTWYQKVHSALFRTPLEMEILKLQEKKGAKISRTEEKAREIANRIKKYAKTPEALKLANDYLTADNKKDAAEAIKKLPAGQKLLDNLRVARAFIDNISQQLVNDPAFDGLPDDLRLAIQDNITTYLRSSYRFFTDKSYKIEKRRMPAIQAQFKQLVAQEIAMLGAMGMSPLDINTIINERRDDLVQEATQMIDGYIADLQDIKYQPSTTGAGIKMPNAPFRRKKDLPDYIKQLLGEEKNPVNRFAQTAQSLSNVLYKGEMIDGIIKLVGTESDYILEQEPESPKNKQYTKVNDPYSLLDGKWVHNEIMDMVNQKSLYSSDKAWANIYFSTLKLARKSKVIWNVTTWRKNLTGGWYFILANGIVNPTFYKDFTRRTKLMFNVRGEKFQVDQETQQLLDIMADKGVTGKSVDANLIGMSQAAFQFGLDGDENAYYERAKRIFNNIAKKDQWLQEKYAAVDDYTKLVIFRSEIQSYAKKLYGKNYEQLSDRQKDNVHEQAAERVKQSTPTFSRLPKWFDKVAVVPIVGDFVSFRLESLRSYGENVANAVSDIKKSQESGLDEVQKKEYLTAGLRRLAGAGSVFALKLAITKLLAQWFLSDDEEELEDDVKNLRPDWMNGQSIIPRSIDKDGNVRVYNYSSEDPYGDVSDIFGGPESWEAMLTDFVRPNIAASLIFNLAKGEDIYGNKIADYSDSRINNMLKIMGYTSKQIIVPPTISSSFRDAWVKSDLPVKDRAINLASTIAERSLIRDYKYNIIDSFLQDLRKISGTRKSYLDYDDPQLRLSQLDEIRTQFESIVAIGMAKGNYDMIDNAERYMKTHLKPDDEEYVFEGTIKK